MKKRSFGTVTMLSLLLMLGANSVNAQHLSESKISVTIPFNFAVGETKLPAGEYLLRRVISTSSADQLSIQSADGRVDLHTGITRPNRTSEIQKQSKLVFNRYGDQYFLSQVWMAGSDIGRDLFKSRGERILSKESKLAKNGRDPQTVTLNDQ
jgi:hypothetical protein